MVNWFGGNGKEYTKEQVLEELRKYAPSRIYVGCDSQMYNNRLIFALAICVTDSGARYWVRRSIESPDAYPSLSMRLINEVVEACTVSDELRNTLNIPITVHADVSEGKKNRSSKVQKRVVNYIKAMGFDYAIKPDSWASFSVADKHSK